MPTLSIIHFQPIEQYPPILNLLKLLDKIENINICVFTTPSNHRTPFTFNKDIQIIYVTSLIHAKNRVTRAFGYLIFNFYTLIRLFFLKPKNILYFESYSAFPVAIYKYLFAKTNVLAHYHEYHDNAWYQHGMKSVKYYHRLEENLIYPTAVWISQTNIQRLILFLKNQKINYNKELHHVVPNYPLKNWALPIDVTYRSSLEFPLRMVYVGSFSSMDTLYIKEINEWVIQQNGNVLLDVYYHQTTSEVKNYLSTHNTKNIRLMGHISYSSLPDILSKYQIGLILYKGAHDNFIHNAPNKLFEYLVCGLDVWYPAEMTGCHAFDSLYEWPKVIPVHFKKLNDYSISTLIHRDTVVPRKIEYTCESVTNELIAKLIS